LKNKRKDLYAHNVAHQEKDMLKRLVINGVCKNFINMSLLLLWLSIILGVTRDGGDFPIYFLTFAGLAITAYFSLVVVPTL
jgi:hypothetical protein